MLILARKIGQSILIGEDIELVVTEIRGDQVRIGIAAPRSIPVRRKETVERIRAENVEAAQAVAQQAQDAVTDILKSTAPRSQPPPDPDSR